MTTNWEAMEVKDQLTQANERIKELEGFELENMAYEQQIKEQQERIKSLHNGVLEMGDSITELEASVTEAASLITSKIILIVELETKLEKRNQDVLHYSNRSHKLDNECAELEVKVKELEDRAKSLVEDWKEQCGEDYARGFTDGGDHERK